MIAAAPGDPILATQTGLPTGLVGQLVVSIQTSLGAFEDAWSTAGITEVPTGSGAYLASRTAPDDEGDYIVAWDRQVTPLDPIRTEGLLVAAAGADGGNGDLVQAGMTPEISEVEELLRARTTVYGDETGTFGSATRPTADQVAGLIEQAVSDIAGRVGVRVPAALIPLSRRIATLRTAMLIEAGYFPEQAGEDESVFTQFNGQFNTGMLELINGSRKAAAAGTILA
jgi:hypothetical protein